MTARALGHGPHVGGLRTLRALGDVELDLLVLLKVAVPGALDRAEVHEDVGTVLLGDEAEALLGAEPLHGASGHEQFPPFLAGANLSAVRRPPACCRYARELLEAALRCTNPRRQSISAAVWRPNRPERSEPPRSGDVILP